MQQDSSFAIRNHFNNNNLPSGYHRDLQLLKDYFQQFKTWACLDIAIFSIKDIKEQYTSDKKTITYLL
jgi:hypothetical protein